eukprot:gene915-542_t
MGLMKRACGLLAPYIVRFGGKKGTALAKNFPVPLRIIHTDTLSPRDVDFLVQCYDYLVEGVKVLPPQATKNYVFSLKEDNALGLPSKPFADGILFDVLFLSGGHAYVGWFYSDLQHIPSYFMKTCLDILKLCEVKEKICLDNRFSLYGEASRLQYCFQIKISMTKPFDTVAPKELHTLHSRHLNYIRTNDVPCPVLNAFARSFLSDARTFFLRSSLGILPQTVRAVEILLRYAVRKKAERRNVGRNGIIEDIKNRCSALKLNWWEPFKELECGFLKLSCSDYPLTLPNVSCPLFETAWSLLCAPQAVRYDRITEQLQTLSLDLLRQEKRILAQLDAPQAIDKETEEIWRAGNAGVLDETVLHYPLAKTRKEPVSVCMDTPIEESRHCQSWMVGMGLDCNGYMSYALRGCDMLCSYFGTHITGPVGYPLLALLLKVRHQLRVYVMRRYAFGSTNIWMHPESALQCYPYFESICLSLQVRSAVVVLHFCRESMPDGSVYNLVCPVALQLLTALYPKLAPCLLFCGTICSLERTKYTKLLSCCVGRSNSGNTISISLTSSQIMELERKAREAEKSDTQSCLIKVGALFREGETIFLLSLERIVPDPVSVCLSTINLNSVFVLRFSKNIFFLSHFFFSRVLSVKLGIAFSVGHSLFSSARTCRAGTHLKSEIAMMAKERSSSESMQQLDNAEDFEETTPDFDPVEAAAQEMHDLCYGMIAFLRKAEPDRDSVVFRKRCQRRFREPVPEQNRRLLHGHSDKTLLNRNNFCSEKDFQKGTKMYFEMGEKMLILLDKALFDRLLVNAGKIYREQRSDGIYLYRRQVERASWRTFPYRWYRHSPFDLQKLRADISPVALENARCYRDNSTIKTLFTLVEAQHPLRNALEQKIFLVTSNYEPNSTQNAE